MVTSASKLAADKDGSDKPGPLFFLIARCWLIWVNKILEFGLRRPTIKSNRVAEPLRMERGTGRVEFTLWMCNRWSRGITIVIHCKGYNQWKLIKTANGPTSVLFARHPLKIPKPDRAIKRNKRNEPGLLGKRLPVFTIQCSPFNGNHWSARIKISKSYLSITLALLEIRLAAKLWLDDDESSKLEQMDSLTAINSVRPAFQFEMKTWQLKFWPAECHHQAPDHFACARTNCLDESPIWEKHCGSGITRHPDEQSGSYLISKLKAHSLCVAIGPARERRMV